MLRGRWQFEVWVLLSWDYQLDRFQGLLCAAVHRGECGNSVRNLCASTGHEALARTQFARRTAKIKAGKLRTALVQKSPAINCRQLAKAKKQASIPSFAFFWRALVFL